MNTCYFYKLFVQVSIDLWSSLETRLKKKKKTKEQIRTFHNLCGYWSSQLYKIWCISLRKGKKQKQISFDFCRGLILFESFIYLFLICPVKVCVLFPALTHFNAMIISTKKKYTSVIFSQMKKYFKEYIHGSSYKVLNILNLPSSLCTKRVGYRAVISCLKKKKEYFIYFKGASVA